MDEDIEKALAEAFEEDFNKLVEQGLFQPVGVNGAGEALYRMTALGLEFIKSQRLIDDFFADDVPRTRRELGTKGHVLTAAVEKVTAVLTLGVVMKRVEGRAAPMYVMDFHGFPKNTDGALLPEEPLLDGLMNKWGMVAAFASLLPDGEAAFGDVTCWERRGREDCRAQLAVTRRGKDIVWYCVRCHTLGLARSWEGTIWDQRGRD